MSCCKQLEKLIQSGDVREDGTKIYIYGSPSFANDGDGHYDDMTDYYPIEFCPFCGTELDQ